MPIVIDPKQKHTVEIEGATFEVSALTGRQVLNLSGQLVEVEQNATAIYSVLHSCIKGWHGVEDSEGRPVACNPASIDHLPVPVAVKIFEFVTNLSGLTAEDTGNS